MVIAGGSGFLGRNLVQRLAAAGHRPVILTRGNPGPDRVQWKPDGSPGGLAAHLEGVDAVVNLAGENLAGDGLAGQRWTAARREAIRRSRIFATRTLLDDLDLLDPAKIYLVQLSDFMWQETRTDEERVATARHFRVFPGEGVHSDALADLVTRLDRIGYRGDYSFEVFNDDYQQMPLPTVSARARRAALWLSEDVLRRAAPLPIRPRLRGA